MTQLNLNIPLIKEKKQTLSSNSVFKKNKESHNKSVERIKKEIHQ